MSAQERKAPEGKEQIQLSFAPLVKEVAPAVVNIYTKRTVSTGFRSPFMNDPFFGDFFGRDFFGGRMRKRVESALGSGVIVSKDGLVVTNAHVVRGAEEITIVLADGNEHEAKLMLVDDASDLALLKVIEGGISFPSVRLKPSETLEVGDLVLAIGNPFGVGQTVTSGIVSAQGRSSLNISDYNFFIQTDAAINPGNSGGPLVAMDGGVVGINTAIYSRSGGSMGIGFAVPSEMVASVIAAAVNGQIGDRGIVRPWLGIQAQDVSADIASNLGMESPNGALVSGLHSVSPLQKAGVKVGDVIISVNGHVIRDAAEMKFRMATVPIGKEASVILLRAGQEMTFEILAIAPPEVPPRNVITLKGAHLLRDVQIGNLNPAIAVELGLQGEEQGVVVLKVPQGGYAMRALAEGDVFLEINGNKIENPDDVEKAILSHAGQRVLQVLLKRGNSVTRLYLR
ncbi:MAG: Do family serine endopeptidase [Alphaproteobacteria bacterium]